MLDLLKQHAWWLAILSGVLGLITALAGFAFLIRLPENYFLPREEPASSVSSRRPIHIVLLVLKNLVGFAILLLGAIMALPLVPGPGLVIVIIGLSLTNFPGKRKLELRILRAPLVLSSVNWLRAKGGRPPFRLPSSARFTAGGSA